MCISMIDFWDNTSYESFTKCYDTTVQFVIEYSAAIWGTKSFSSISAVQNRACRYFLGLGRYALTGISVGYHQNIDNGCVSRESGAGWST